MAEKLHVRYDTLTREAIDAKLADERDGFATKPRAGEADLLLAPSVTALTDLVPWTATRVTVGLDGLEVNAAKLPPVPVDRKLVTRMAIERCLLDPAVPQSVKDALGALRETL